jgi:cytochrome c peroxidase
MKRYLGFAGLALVVGGIVWATLSTGTAPTGLSPMEELGKQLFFDTDLSSPPGQNCADCHGPEVGFTGPDGLINGAGSVYEGAVGGRFGNRRPPAAAYAGDSPPLHRDEEGTFVGGMFWDGRATGEVLGDPLAEQAMGPFLNPLEQNFPDRRSLIQTVREADYADLFEQVWGERWLNADVDEAFECVARSIAAYERSAEVNPFSSRFDDFWRAATAAGLDVETIDEDNLGSFRGLGLTDRELNGLVLFNTSARCADCHVLTSIDGRPPVFTDFTYDNLGVPVNPQNPFYRQAREFNPDGEDWVDKGLGGFLETVEEFRPFAEEHYGSHKVPTLRNVDARPSADFAKAYMHNGCFKTLKDVVHFYNTRDVDEAGWPPPEVAENINRDEMGNLGLTEDEEDAIVDFLKTLTDLK